jgi:serine protease Do
MIVRPDGYILTNLHVVEEAESIEVRLQDGRRFPATMQGQDPQSDLAVIRIDARDLPTAKLGDSGRLRVGEFVLTVGSPYRLDYTVTVGHVSAKGRSQVLQNFSGQSMDQDFIQTDALINPGNSGGPLVNLDGEVVGVITLIRGLNTGIGFAVPSNLAREISEALITEGKFTRAWLGIGIQALRDDRDLQSVVKGIQDGVVVTMIVPDGPAAQSDLKAGDIITAIEQQSVATPQQLRAAVRSRSIGRPISLTVFRKEESLKIQVTPQEWKQAQAVVEKAAAPPTPAKNTEPAKLGMEVESLTVELAKRFGVNRAGGVVVTTVEDDSPAARKGLQPGDLITAVNQQPVNTAKQFQALIEKSDLRKGVMLNLVSGRTARFTILKAKP